MNILKSFALLAGLSGLLLVIGQLVGGTSGLVIALVLAMAMNFYSYFNSDKLAIRMAQAVPMDEREYPDVYEIVRRLAAKAGEPMPRLFISPSPQLNAFATGRDPEHAAVCVNRGLYESLTNDELEGVLGHELQHVYNRDILVGSIAATIATAISFLAILARFGAFFGGGRGDDRGNPIALLAAAIVAPLAATVIQLAVTRSREAHADHTGAELTGKPLALASALRKLEAAGNDPRRHRMGASRAETSQAMAHMFIAAPFGGRVAGNLFRSHPRTEDRVAALEQQAREMGQL